MRTELAFKEEIEANMPTIKINHIALVTEDMATTVAFWEQAFGLSVTRTVHDEEEAVEVAFLSPGETEIEIIAPTNDENGVARYLAKRGTGLHHLCIEVDDIEASLCHLVTCGVELINDEPKINKLGRRYAFVHPKSTGGGAD